MTLHEEIAQILKEAEKPLFTSEISKIINEQKNYKKKNGSGISQFQVHGRTRNYPNLFIRNKSLVGLKGRDEEAISKTEYDNLFGNDYRANNPPLNRIFNINSIQKLENENVHKVKFLNKYEFINLGSIRILQKNGLPKIDELNSCGIYAITKSDDYQPIYYSVAEAKINGNVINPWSIERLSEKWVETSDILYYGLAGANMSRSLKSRLTDLINHSKGIVSDRGPHKGGEIIWQLKEYENFEVCILQTGKPPEPRIIEANLLKQFYLITGKLPFANRKF